MLGTLCCLCHCANLNAHTPTQTDQQAGSCNAQVGTPITVPSQGFVDLGRIASMELNHKVQYTPCVDCSLVLDAAEHAAGA